MSTPKELRYSEEHEWVKTEGDKVRIGITDFAQSEPWRHRICRAFLKWETKSKRTSLLAALNP